MLSPELVSGKWMVIVFQYMADTKLWFYQAWLL